MRRIKVILGFVVISTAFILLSVNGTALAISRPGPLLRQAFSTTGYPPDPTADLPWSSGFSGVADIQAHFNAARTAENSQLGLSIPMLTLPSQADWSAMSEPQRALWLINRERIDRGIPALDGLEANVSGVAQTYADYLLAQDAFGHNADGRSPWDRLEANPAIGACFDFLNIAENLAYFATSGNAIPLTLERTIYVWMYDDGGCCAWGHRHAILWYPYTENGGSPVSEGFLGIGRAKGGPYQSLNYAEITVMNVFDPCSAWNYNPGATYTISGRVTDGQGNGLPGVAISAGAAGSVETGADGSYAFTNLAAGTYTLTPALSGYTFTPPSRQVTLTSAGSTSQDFVAAPEESRPTTLFLPVVVQPRTGASATPNAGLWTGVSLVDGQPGDPSETSTSQYEFKVNADQATLAYFKMKFYVYACPGSYEFAYAKPVRVVNGKFAADNYDKASEKSKYSFKGGFFTPDTARGSMQLIKYYLEGCGSVTGEGEWIATRKK